MQNMQTVNQDIERVMPDLKRYARSLADSEDRAEDLVQDCVERALTKIELYKPGTNFRSWMFTVMHNLFITEKRRQKVSMRYVETVRHQGNHHARPNQMHRVFLNETMDKIENLSDEEREAVNLLGIEERSHREAASKSKQPVGTMKSRLSRGRSKLRDRLEIAEATSAESRVH